jgi:hypothetical protein
MQSLFGEAEAITSEVILKRGIYIFLQKRRCGRMSRFLKTLIGLWITPVCLLVLFAAQAAAVTPENPAWASREEGAVARVEGLEGGLPPEAAPQGIRPSVSGLDILGPVEGEERYGEYHPEIPGESLPDPDDPTSGFLPSASSEQGLRHGEVGGLIQGSSARGVEGALQGGTPGLEGLGAPPGNEPQWGDDILVHDGVPFRHADWDEDEETGDLYVIVDLNHLTPDTNVIYRSTDGGENWTVWARNINSDGYITQAKIRVARDGAGETWICAFGIWAESDPVQRILWMGQRPSSGGTWTWSMVDDDVSEMDADADVGDGANVYVVYIPYGTESDIWAARHTLSGGWVENQSLFSNPETLSYPQIAAGAGGNVAVTFLDTRLTTDDEVRVKRSTDGGVSWLASQQVSDNTGGFPLSYTDIASSHGETQTEWIFATFDVSSIGEGLNLAYYYSTDSGVNWTYAGLIGSSPDDEWESTLRARKATGSVTVAYMSGGIDSVMVTATTAASPTGFYYPLRANDAGTEGVFPTAGWMTRGGWAFPGVVFDGWVGSETVVDVYFDWRGNGTMFVGLVPDATVIPRGGTLRMTAYVTNAWSSDQSIEFWTNVTLPNGGTWPADETLVGPIHATIQAGETLSGRISHRIPGNAPLNTFTYKGLLGPEFPTVWTFYSFSFTVVAGSGLEGTAGPQEGVPDFIPLIENTNNADIRDGGGESAE